jgi:hypothetical protein
MSNPKPASKTNDAPNEIEALFVQTANSMSYHGGKLNLHGLAPTTLFFSDRPDRVTGHITSEDFVDSWDKGNDSFASDPPNAVLSIFHREGVSDVVVVLDQPELAHDILTYNVEILDGEMPAKGGHVSLFIDTIGRPLSPVSVAGMNRRERRRDRRY